MIERAGGPETTPAKGRGNLGPSEWPEILLRRFDLIVFDWDGTAVHDRFSSLGNLLPPLESLLCAGVPCVIITGTNLPNLLNQGLAKLTPEAKKSLIVCANRGSEVFAFGTDGLPRQIFSRRATAEEDLALNRAVNWTRDYTDSFLLKTAIIADRLNRRKLDIIPITAWQNPKKSQFRELFDDVACRLRSFGIEGGLNQLIEKTYSISKSAGLKEPKITSDIKNIEIGLTDKADSVRWIDENVIKARSIPLKNCVVFGDEFGPVGDVSGSDSMMRIPELKGAVFVSVGAEPGGVPHGVIGLGGGPDRFVDFLSKQLEWHQTGAAPIKNYEPVENQSWLLEQEGFDPSREREMESLFTIGNGFMGVRGASDFLIPTSQADMFVAGVYDRKVRGLPYADVEIIDQPEKEWLVAELVPFPSPLRWSCYWNGKRLDLSGAGSRGHGRKLDLLQGLYFEKAVFSGAASDFLSIRTSRCCSLTVPGLLLQEMEFSSSGISGEFEIRAPCGILNFEASYPHLLQEKSIQSEINGQGEVFKTKFSGRTLRVLTRLFADGRPLGGTHYKFRLKDGDKLRFRRFVRVSTENGEPAAGLGERDFLGLSWSDFESLVDRHIDAWKNFWLRGDVVFDGDTSLTQAQRFNIYHLKIGASRKNSVGARAFTGRAYEGHVFWDTETFMFPFYVHTEPSAARDLLSYRYSLLDRAREHARELGYEGACFPWESAATGEDVTPTQIRILGEEKLIPIFTGSQQIHISADVAHAVWKYWEATGDDDFMAGPGFEILAETARFWASRCRFEKGAFHIQRVIGPDEYHHSVNDNAFTNWMARFNLERAVDCYEWLVHSRRDETMRLPERLGIAPREVQEWRNTAKNLYLPAPNRQGVIEQHEGFFDLRPVSFQKEQRWRAPIDRLLDWDEVNRFKVLKQADVLMIPFLFPEAMPKDLIRANYEYYEPLTEHASSLSLCVHGAMAARIGLRDQAWTYWNQSLNFDLLNKMRNTALGLHLGCMGGTWQALVFHFLGLRFENGGVIMDGEAAGRLPESVENLNFRLVYRGKTLPVSFVRKRGS